MFPPFNKGGQGGFLMIEIGIDEAGYGPLLGPLVVTAWGMSVPEGTDLWNALSGVVSRRKDKGRTVVADSKAVYSSGSGLKRLEESVLVLLRASGVRPSTHAGLLRAVVPKDILDESLWHDPRKTAIPLAADSEAVKRAGSQLRTAMKEAGVSTEYVSSRVVTPQRFNRGITETNNKSVMLFSHVAQLITDAASHLGEGLSRVTVDNIGSTKRYRGLLERFFFGWSILRRKETRQMSRYTMAAPDGPSFDLRFVKKGDVKHFLVALSSMQSKYLREIEMTALNDFWRREIPRIPPTAGYPGDAKRFIARIGQRAKKLGIPACDFIRTR